MVQKQPPAKRAVAGFGAAAMGAADAMTPASTNAAAVKPILFMAVLLLGVIRT
jgi:hypothetical protein